MPELLWLLLEDDPEMRRKVWVGYDRAGTPRSARVEQEVDDIIEANAEAEKATHGARFGDYNRVASVPLTFIEKTGLDQAIDARDRRYISKILNDGDFQKFRTSRGRV
jgi:hypothetical protein